VISALGDESGVISSTEIRKLVSVGSVSEARRLLGRPYALQGLVIRGDGRGKKIGVPTANIDYPHEKIVPALGIYAGWAYVADKRHKAAISIGINPTFTPDKNVPSVEAYILDFDEDIYGEQLKIEFIARLRDELKFDSVETLVKQIWQDVEETRKLLNA
jgi:riboflavin kinase/FMN adenylyltransferase